MKTTELDSFYMQLTKPLADYCYRRLINGMKWSRVKAENHIRITHNQNAEEMRHLSANIDNMMFREN